MKPTRPSHPAPESPVAVYGAIAANVGIAVTKFAVAAITGSSAMLSEGVHSTVDTLNGMLLLVGLKWSKRPATPEHPFGHAREVYFWSLMVAVLIFGLGGGVSFYEGVHHILHPVALTDPTWNYVVLGLASLFEASSFAIALRQFMLKKNGAPFWQALWRSKDPTIYTVMAEDSAALAGLLLAAAGIFLSHRYGLPELDGVASLLIGLLLGAVALLLVHQARGLLIGEGMRPESAATIRRMAQAQPVVEDVGPVRSVYLGPEEVLVSVALRFKGDVATSEATRSLAELKRDMQSRFPMIAHLMIEVQEP